MRCWGVLLLGLLLTASARAEPPPANPLLPSALALAHDEGRRTAAQLEQSLTLLPDVKSARVQLALAPGDSHPLDRPAPAARMSVVLQLTGPGPSDSDVQELALASTSRRLELPVSVVRAQAPVERAAHQTTARVGPFEVAASSAGALRATLGLCLAANVCLATLILVRRKRRGRRNQQN
jgi:hypothetical protein